MTQNVCTFFYGEQRKTSCRDPDDIRETKKSMEESVVPKEFVIPRSVAALTVIRRRRSVPRLTSDYAPQAGLTMMVMMMNL